MALAMSRRDVDGLVRLYADSADCLDLGVVTPSALRREYEKQFQRWPQFSWQLVGEPVVEQLDSGRCRLAFSVSFKAANPATKRSSSGRADEQMLLASDASGTWKIVSQRETVNRTGSAPVVRGEPVNMNTVPPTSAAGERGRRKAEERARQLQSMMFPGYHP
jgi:ketosteroid isomerase-like protein